MLSLHCLHRLRAGLVALALVAIPAVAHAAPTPHEKAAARALMDEGDKHVEARDFTRALQSFRDAHAIMNVPTTGIEVARCYERLGLLVDARAEALAVTKMPAKPNEPGPFKQARADAAKLEAALATRIPSLRVSVEPADASVRIDRDPVSAFALNAPLRLNPGPHTVRASAFGREATTSFTLAEGEEKSITLKVPMVESAPTAPTPTPAPKATTRVTPAWAYVGLGVGAVGLGLGAVTGLLSLARASDAKELCVDTRCREAARGDIDASITLGNVSNVAFAVGVLGAGVGIFGLVTAPKREAAGATVRPIVGLGSVGVRGTF